MAEARRFRDARDWSQFHTPKNLAAAIAIEAAELQERFLWKTDKEIDRDLKDAAKRDAVVEEVADILLFALLLADRLDIDVGTVACLGNPDPGDMKVYRPTGKETFDDDETTEEAPPRGGRCQAARR